jgi:hypothetical protein
VLRCGFGDLLASSAFEVIDQLTGAFDQRREAVDFDSGLGVESARHPQSGAWIGGGASGWLGLFLTFGSLGLDLRPVFHRRHGGDARKLGGLPLQRGAEASRCPPPGSTR